MNIKKVLKVALGTGLFLLDQSDEAKRNVRDRVSDQVDDLRDRAQDTYQAAADRVAGASDALRGRGRQPGRLERASICRRTGNWNWCRPSGRPGERRAKLGPSLRRRRRNSAAMSGSALLLPICGQPAPATKFAEPDRARSGPKSSRRGQLVMDLRVMPHFRATVPAPCRRTKDDGGERKNNDD